MNHSSTSAAGSARYELRFISLFNGGRGYAFPCDGEGHVEIDDLSLGGRSNYSYARVVVGNELSTPTIALVAGSTVSSFVHRELIGEDFRGSASSGRK